MKKTLFLIFALASLGINAQGLISETLQTADQFEQDELHSPQCGSHFLMAHQEQVKPGYQKAADLALEKIVKQKGLKSKAASATLSIPVVFHIVHNNPEENLPDSLIHNQIKVLNDNYGRLNADTATLRPEFLPYAGNPKIKFELASQDPNGNPSTGIVRKNTNIEYFGGVLPYNANQSQLIQQWVDDSLFYNFYRISQDSLGGSSAWDPERYLNIWLGDLRLFEPEFNNFEELIFLGLAQPPKNHPSFAGMGFDTLPYEQGILMHYVALGPNNPNSYPPPYGNLNSSLDEGDLLSHEAGHYLGLRHIWGDGPCSADDFISDTPLSNNSNQFTGNKLRNSCFDSIDGQDLPDMVENFMDYSSDACLNSFTKEQASVMRACLYTYRPNLFTIGQSEITLREGLQCYPNPSAGRVNLINRSDYQNLRVCVYTNSGQKVLEKEFGKQSSLAIELKGEKGLYLIRITHSKSQATFRVLKL